MKHSSVTNQNVETNLIRSLRLNCRIKEESGAIYPSAKLHSQRRFCFSESDSHSKLKSLSIRYGLLNFNHMVSV